MTSAALEGVRPRWIGRVSYLPAWERQRAQRARIVETGAGEAFWLLEHDPVITTGRRGVEDLPPVSVLQREGIDLVRTERGGLATWHGPGQLVGYLLLDLARHGLLVRTMIAGVEEGVRQWLATREIAAGRREGYPGVWVGRDKICAVGMHFRKGVSMHGFALNLCPDLRGFSHITPCGVRDGGVTSVEQLTGQVIAPEIVAEEVGRTVLEALGASRR